MKVAQEVFDDNDENDIRYDVHVPGDGWSDVRGKDTDGAADEELSDDCLKTDILGNELRVNKMRSVFCVSCAHLHIVILVTVTSAGILSNRICLMNQLKNSFGIITGTIHKLCYQV